MPWPLKIARVFATANIVLHENHDFIVSPNFIPGNGADLIISFEISLRQHPVLVLEVKPLQHLLLDSTRETADS
ncbi:hypothetical protein J3R83DRAFT_30 [Lanmaoa asiatica]|nr:hypothetical protein J3R83DRAFT_30 [Lanmaoa asiatica]